MTATCGQRSAAPARSLPRTPSTSSSIHCQMPDRLTAKPGASDGGEVRGMSRLFDRFRVAERAAKERRAAKAVQRSELRKQQEERQEPGGDSKPRPGHPCGSKREAR